MNNLEPTARAFALFSAGYPSAKKTDESTVRVWAEALAGFSGDSIESAAKHWIHTEQHYPNLPRFIELVRAQQGATLENVYRANYECAVCEGEGWEYTNHAGRGVVGRCRNGCMPPRMGEISEAGTESTASPDVIAMLREAQDAAKARRNEIGDIAYLEEQGYASAKHRISDGMILAKHTPRAAPAKHEHQGQGRRVARGLGIKRLKALYGEEQRTGITPTELKVARAQMAAVARRWDTPRGTPAVDAWESSELGPA